MHSLNKNFDGTYCVGRIDVVYQGDGVSRSQFVAMFDNLSIRHALWLVGALNGGDLAPLWSLTDEYLVGKHV